MNTIHFKVNLNLHNDERFREMGGWTMLLAAISLFLSTSHRCDAAPDMDLMQLSPSDVHTSTLDMFLWVEEKRKDYLNIIYQFCSAC